MSKKVKTFSEAVGYVLQATKQTPSRLLKNLETSEGYSGKDYNRWLAAQLIVLAKEAEITFTQLLADWPKLVIDAMESSPRGEMTLEGRSLVFPTDESDFVLVPHEKVFHEEGLGDEEEWISGPVDIQGMYEFSDELGIDSEVPKLNIISYLPQNDKESGNFPLRILAKEQGIKPSSNGEYLLMRFLNIAKTHVNSNVNLTLISHTDFWNHVDPALLRDFLDMFPQTSGERVRVSDLFENDLSGEDYLITQFSTSGEVRNYFIYGFSPESGLQLFAGEMPSVDVGGRSVLTEIFINGSKFAFREEFSSFDPKTIVSPKNGISGYAEFISNALPLAVEDGMDIPEGIGESFRELQSPEAMELSRYQKRESSGIGEAEDVEGYSEMRSRAVSQLSRQVRKDFPRFQ